MAMSAALLPEFDHEMANTRKILERVPDDKFDWKPHVKSFALGDLATHVANLPSWTVETIEKDALDIAPSGGEPYRVTAANSQSKLLERFDSNIAAARAALAGASDEHLVKPWSLLKGGAVMFTLPRVAVLRGFVMNHLIHHRGQLSVYLRLNDVPVPGLYGPSADEAPM
jgi:uncharacterized damage-inducible protein DinB